jgi:hypothetical protein
MSRYCLYLGMLVSCGCQETTDRMDVSIVLLLRRVAGGASVPQREEPRQPPLAAHRRFFRRFWSKVGLSASIPLTISRISWALKNSSTVEKRSVMQAKTKAKARQHPITKTYCNQDVLHVHGNWRREKGKGQKRFSDINMNEPARTHSSSWGFAPHSLQMS